MLVLIVQFVINHIKEGYYYYYMRPCQKIYLAYPGKPTFPARKIYIICMSAACLQYFALNASLGLGFGLITF